MVRITVESDVAGEDKGILAALIGLGLISHGIKCVILDPSSGEFASASELAIQQSKLKVKVAELSERNAASGERVIVQTGTIELPKFTSADFEIRQVDLWWNLSNPTAFVGDPRPHIVGVTRKAQEFIRASLHSPMRDNVTAGTFGPMYTGYGFVTGPEKPREERVMAFRLKQCPIEYQQEKLDAVDAAFRRWMQQQEVPATPTELNALDDITGDTL
jgi:hypothetical protein